MSGDTTRGAASWPNYALPFATTVNGYRIERVLGSGGFGVTYLARDLLQQPFAIKEYYPRQFATRQELNVLAASAEDEPLFEECRERFLREAQALVLLTRVAGPGDGIVRVRTYFEAYGTCYLVMDYVEGANLASVLQKEPGGLAAPRVHALLSELLSAIGVVHRAGLMHRDIKPANIILRDDDKVVLIDFGSSREATSGQTTAYTQIYSGGYAPPEQMLGTRQGMFSDIYAIGAVCYRAIGGTVVDALARQIALAGGRPDPQPPAAQVGAGRYPGPLLAAIDAALAVDPTQRPQSVAEMRAALGRDEPARDELVGDATVMAARRPPPSSAPPPQRQPQPGRQHRRGVWGVIAGAAVVVAVGAAYFVLLGPATLPPAGRQEVAAGTPASVPSSPVATPQVQRRTAQPPPADRQAQPATPVRGPSDVAPAPVPVPSPTEAAPAVAPARVPPAEPPQRPSAEPAQHQGAVVPPPAPVAPQAAPTAPQAAPTVGTAPISPAPPPQHEAMAVPLPAPAPAAPESAPAVGPAPQSPAPSPQHETMAAPPPAAAPALPEVTSTSGPAPVSPVPPPQHEAMVVPPPATLPPPAPSPRAAPSPLELARSSVQSLPCSILRLTSGRDGLRVAGLAPDGQELDRLLATLHALGRLTEDITRVDRFACQPMATVDPLVRQTWDATPPTFAVRLDRREVASGVRLAIDVATTLPAVYVDLYQGDGTVRHLLRPLQPGKPGKPHVAWIAAPPPGPRLVVAIGSATPLDLGARPDTERAAAYLAVLQAGLQNSAVTSSADVAMMTVRAAEPAVAKVPQPHPANARSDRCANIISRVQLGETLSDEERAALRTDCRS